MIIMILFFGLVLWALAFTSGFSNRPPHKDFYLD